MQSSRSWRWWLWAMLWVLTAALLFYLPGWRQTRGVWPAPLDDSYIYYDFARSAAQGRPFQWLAGNGYSSGATSVLYPLLLAPFWLAGLRGPWLGLGAAMVALLALLELSRCVATLLRSEQARWLVPPLLVAVPLLDWSWFSGMEVAFYGAVAGRALLSCQRAIHSAASRRGLAQWRAGLWLALLVMARPEAIALGFCLAVAVAHAGRSFSAPASLLRLGTPAATWLATQAALNRVFTGEVQAAGAIRKLYAHNPFSSVENDSLGVVKNLIVLFHQGLLRAFGGGYGLLLAVLFWGYASFSKTHRRLARAQLLGALGMTLLVSLNNTARYQNYRYIAPCLLAGLITIALGYDSLLQNRWLRRSRYLRAGPFALTALLFVATAGELPRQRHHFALASRNIVEQHGVMAQKLAAMTPPPQRVLVGDAGAIPYLSGLPALDGLGLGGYHQLPLARASRHGIPCVVELIERLPHDQRPDVMALYPGWWPGLADVFGRRLASVRIRDNVICAADEKVLYRADWSTLAPPRSSASDTPPRNGPERAWLRLDVADLVDERQHHYRFEGDGGRVVAETLLHAGKPRWDAGRSYPGGSSETFEVVPTTTAKSPRGQTLAAATPARLRLRIGRQQHTKTLRIEVWRDQRQLSSQQQSLPSVSDAQRDWQTMDVALASIRAGDRVRLTSADDGRWVSYQLWLLPAAR